MPVEVYFGDTMYERMPVHYESPNITKRVFIHSIGVKVLLEELGTGVRAHFNYNGKSYKSTFAYHPAQFVDLQGFTSVLKQILTTQHFETLMQVGPDIES